MRSRRRSDGRLICIIITGALLALPIHAGAAELSDNTDRLSGFAAMLSENNMKGTAPSDSNRLSPEDDTSVDVSEIPGVRNFHGYSQNNEKSNEVVKNERLQSFSQLAGELQRTTKTVSGESSDLRLTGFAGEIAKLSEDYDKKYGTSKEDNVVITNVPAGALWVTKPDDIKPMTEEEVKKKAVQDALARMKGMSDEEIIMDLLTGAANSGLPDETSLSGEEKIVYNDLLDVYGDDIDNSSPWAASKKNTREWTAESWDRLFPYDADQYPGKPINVGEYTLTAYCPCELCTGKRDGITYSGTKACQGRTIAVDPALFRMGDQVMIDGHVFTCEDTGKAIKSTHIDIFMDSHEEALSFGTRKAEVYLMWNGKKK
ncbi:MAG: 3D domain-containing protein [Lachnospiraceae bacterium]|nr:3D domain-containing protein [Lachnospiraceae bacterium]